jgi:hypothetical protein
MKAQISWDLVMDEDMAFVEGTFRLPDQEWQVFIFGPDSSVSVPEAKRGRWESGVTGIFVKWPRSTRLNKEAVFRLLSQQLGVTEWEEAVGPDSMQLR